MRMVLIAASHVTSLPEESPPTFTCREGLITDGIQGTRQSVHWIEEGCGRRSDGARSWLTRDPIEHVFLRFIICRVLSVRATKTRSCI